MPANLENSAVVTGLEKVSFHSNLKERSNYRTIALISHKITEKAMAIHSSTLAWKIPWTEEPDGLQFMASLRVRHDWATLLFTFRHWRRKWQPTPVLLQNPGETSWTGEPGGLPSVGSHRVGHDGSDLAAAAHASKVMLKILQARLQQYMNCELPDVQSWF